MKTVRDYYMVTVPGEVADDIDTLADIAISDARERTRLYAMPATWTATIISGEPGDYVVTFRVRRTRRKPA